MNAVSRDRIWITHHAFLPTPFYPDLCDAYQEDGRRCARPGREHDSCEVHVGHQRHYPVLQTNGQIQYLRCEVCLLWLGDLSEMTLANMAAVVERVVPEKERILRDAIIKSLKLIRAAQGGLVHNVETILQQALDQTSGK